ncbi:polyhomeotic-like protein 2 [Phlebotomus papatasi]|uniref:polyhomeotic-like protein 2 n=1 Tax=Phlebotomus papatasi TaxID=29031 RepID=UPI0024846BD5|nr:polyhomeotic-like protein 2 [Phlebotomus papatasi]
MSGKRKQIHGRNPSRGDKEGGLLPVRVGGRIKKAKTIFDPSESLYPKKRRMELIQTPKQLKKPEELPKRKRKDSHSAARMVSNGEDSSSERKGLSFYQGWCLICLKNHPKLITCKTCSYKAHFECLDKRSGTKFEDLENNWHCPQCKFCTVCQKTADFGILTQCTRCYEFYHNTCHRPRIITKGSQRDKWICRYCRQEDASGVSSESGLDESASSGEATPAKRTSPDKDNKEDPKDAKKEGKASPDQSEHDSSSEKVEKSIEKPDKKEKREKLEMVTSTLDPVPDASSWTSLEVYNYFSRHFPNEAEVFREQEIDGASLVLMKRDDVVSGLKLKLGPAIRIYRHVLMLQKRSSDPRLSWF